MTETPRSTPSTSPSSPDANYVSEVEQALSQLGAGLVPTEPAELGSRIGKYQIVQVLHCHGQAVVALARDPDLERDVILKLYHAAKTDQQRARLLNEGRALARIQSRHVATVFAVEEFEDFVFLVIEYVRGLSLRELLMQQEPPGQVSAEEALPVVRELAEGLQHVHQLGLLHRDLKPENVMVTPEGDVKLIDFGLVSLVDSENANDRSGTPAYMAPECARADKGAGELDQRSDIFGLGAVLYDMLVGQPPFAAATNAQSRELAVVGKVVPVRKLEASVSEEVARFCMRCLSERPDERFDTVDAVVARLDELTEQFPDTESSGVSRGWLPVLAALLAASALAMLAWQFLPSRNSPDLDVSTVGDSNVKDGQIENGQVATGKKMEGAEDVVAGENVETRESGKTSQPLKSGERIRLQNCEIVDHYLSVSADGNAILHQDANDHSLWQVESRGAGVALKNVATSQFLTGENWEVFTSNGKRDGSVWLVSELEGGNVSLANFDTGRYLDGDGPVDNFDVDESEEVKADDSWIVRRP